MTNEAESTRGDWTSRWNGRLEILIAVLLGLAAVATAWAGYQASLMDGEALQAYSQSTIKSDEASFFYSQGNQTAIEDNALFAEYAKANWSGNPDDADLAEYLKNNLMSDELAQAVDWWNEQTDESLESPFVDQNPYLASLESEVSYGEAESLEAESKQLFADGTKRDDTGDEYTLATVILATSLFLLGIAGVFRVFYVRVGLMILGTVLLVIPVIQILQLDRI